MRVLYVFYLCCTIELITYLSICCVEYTNNNLLFVYFIHVVIILTPSGVTSGGAKLSEPVLKFFTDIGIPVLEGYGLTETCKTVVYRYAHIVCMLISVYILFAVHINIFIALIRVQYTCALYAL